MKENKTDRDIVEPIHLHAAIETVKDMLNFRLDEKGAGTFKSRHEMFGIIAEEFYELANSMQDGNRNFDDEVLDLAVACVFGLACIEAQKMDW